MKRPNAVGQTLQVVEPLIQKLAELEDKALRGEAMTVVALSTAARATSTETPSEQ